MGLLNLDLVQGRGVSSYSNTPSLDNPSTQKEEDKKGDSYRLEFAFEKLKELLPQGVMILGGVVGGCALSYLARRAFPFLAAGGVVATGGVIAINALGGVAGGEIALGGLSLFLNDYASTLGRHLRGDDDVDTIEELVVAYAHQWFWSTFQSGAIGMAGRGVGIGAKTLVASGGSKAVVGKGLQVVGSKLDWTNGQVSTLTQLGHQIPREYVEEVSDEVASRIWKPLEYVLGAARGGKVNVDTRVQTNQNNSPQPPLNLRGGEISQISRLGSTALLGLSPTIAMAGTMDGGDFGGNHWLQAAAVGLGLLGMARRGKVFEVPTDGTRFPVTIDLNGHDFYPLFRGHDYDWEGRVAVLHELAQVAGKLPPESWPHFFEAISRKTDDMAGKYFTSPSLREVNNAFYNFDHPERATLQQSFVEYFAALMATHGRSYYDSDHLHLAEKLAEYLPAIPETARRPLVERMSRGFSNLYHNHQERVAIFRSSLALLSAADRTDFLRNIVLRIESNEEDVAKASLITIAVVIDLMPDPDAAFLAMVHGAKHAERHVTYMASEAIKRTARYPSLRTETRVAVAREIWDEIQKQQAICKGEGEHYYDHWKVREQAKLKVSDNVEALSALVPFLPDSDQQKHIQHLVDLIPVTEYPVNVSKAFVQTVDDYSPEGCSRVAKAMLAKIGSIPADSGWLYLYIFGAYVPKIPEQERQVYTQWLVDQIPLVKENRLIIGNLNDCLPALPVEERTAFVGANKENLLVALSQFYWCSSSSTTITNYIAIVTISSLPVPERAPAIEAFVSDAMRSIENREADVDATVGALFDCLSEEERFPVIEAFAQQLKTPPDKDPRIPYHVRGYDAVSYYLNRYYKPWEFVMGLVKKYGAQLTPAQRTPLILLMFPYLDRYEKGFRAMAVQAIESWFPSLPPADRVRVCNQIVPLIGGTHTHVRDWAGRTFATNFHRIPPKDRGPILGKVADLFENPTNNQNGAVDQSVTDVLFNSITSLPNGEKGPCVEVLLDKAEGNSRVAILSARTVSYLFPACSVPDRLGFFRSIHRRTMDSTKADCLSQHLQLARLVYDSLPPKVRNDYADAMLREASPEAQFYLYLHEGGVEVAEIYREYTASADPVKYLQDWRAAVTAYRYGAEVKDLSDQRELAVAYAALDNPSIGQNNYGALPLSWSLFVQRMRRLREYSLPPLFLTKGFSFELTREIVVHETIDKTVIKNAMDRLIPIAVVDSLTTWMVGLFTASPSKRVWGPLKRHAVTRWGLDPRLNLTLPEGESRIRELIAEKGPVEVLEEIMPVLAANRPTRGDPAVGEALELGIMAHAYHSTEAYNAVNILATYWQAGNKVSSAFLIETLDALRTLYGDPVAETLKYFSDRSVTIGTPSGVTKARMALDAEREKIQSIGGDVVKVECIPARTYADHASGYVAEDCSKLAWGMILKPEFQLYRIIVDGQLEGVFYFERTEKGGKQAIKLTLAPRRRLNVNHNELLQKIGKGIGLVARQAGFDYSLIPTDRNEMGNLADMETAIVTAGFPEIEFNTPAHFFKSERYYVLDDSSLPYIPEPGVAFLERDSETGEWQPTVV